MKKVNLSLIFLLFAFVSFAQIKGKVVDGETGESLIGVTVVIKGTTTGVATDLNGGFSLTGAPSGSQTLVFSYVGYNTYEMPIVVTGKSQQVGTIELDAESVGLEKVEVLANFMDEKRQPPTPISTVSALEIEEKMGAQEFPELLKSTPGVFVNTVGGSFGAARVKIRGFGSENSATMINGIPVNDMENGYVYWSNWGGMNDVTRSQQIQRGLGVSKLAVSSVGGTINIITKPTEHRKGVKLSYGNSNRSWSHRMMLTASTGLMKNGWAITALGSRRWGQGYRDETAVNSWAYFLTVSKAIGDKHQLIFTGFGAPQTTNRAWNGLQSAYDIVGDKKWNVAWGYKDGKKFNLAKNRYHKPMFILNHYYDINENMTLSNAVYFSTGRGGSTGLTRAPRAFWPVPTFNINASTPKEKYQIQWDELVEGNKASGSSNHVIHESLNNHNWVGAISTLNWDVNDKVSVTAGLDWRWYRGFHYRVLEDLLGGEYFIDKDNRTDKYNNLLEPAGTKKVVGDKIGYNYNSTVNWAGLFVQAEYTAMENLDLFATATVSRSSFYRKGFFLNESFKESSLGASKTYNFTNYTVKAGANYRITGRHNVFVNAGTFTRAPFFRGSFLDGRITNRTLKDLQSEKIIALEGGYGYRSARFAANFNLYRTFWGDRNFVDAERSELFGGDNVVFITSGVDAIHQGIELDFVWKATSDLEIKGMASIGDWRWKGNAKATVLGLGSTDPLAKPDGKSTLEEPLDILLDNKKVGGSAQVVSAIGVRYRNPKFWYVGGSINYYDYLYAEYSPVTFSNVFKDDPQYNDYFNSPTKMPNAITFDIYGGKSWKFNDKYYLKLSFNINNITNNAFIIDSERNAPTPTDLTPSPFVQYYYGRTYFAGITFSFK